MPPFLNPDTREGRIKTRLYRHLGEGCLKKAAEKLGRNPATVRTALADNDYRPEYLLDELETLLCKMDRE